VGYFSTKYDRRYKYIIGVVQYFENELIWIDFLGVHTRKQIGSESDLSTIISNIFDNLIEYYQNYIFADVRRIFEKHKTSDQLSALMAHITNLNIKIDKTS
jgi:hypothetical protein